MIDKADPPEEAVAYTAGRTRLFRTLSAVGIVALLLGAASLFTALEAQATASGGSIQATVNYALVARRGEVIPLRITVSGVGEEPVTVWIRDSYLADLELFGWTPAPTTTQNRTNAIGVTFPAATEALDIALDGRLLPSTQLGTHEFSVVVETEVGELDFLLRTLVLP